MKKELVLVEANLSFQQMEEAIPKIGRRLAELNEFDVNLIMEYGDARVQALENKLDALLVSIFGIGTVEYNRYRNSTTTIMPITFSPSMTFYEVQDGVRRNLEIVKEQLESIKSIFVEELQDAGQGRGGKSLKAYESLELHPDIEKVAGALYKNGHYANAVEDAVKALNALVRLKSGIKDKDGTPLMEFVFSARQPVLKFNNLSDTSDFDEQKGFMMMFSGAVSGLRNPRAHKIIADNPERALEFIAFISLLAKLADKSYR